MTSLLPQGRSILWRCSPIIDLVETSMIHALWSPGLFINGKMQKFVTSMSVDLYPASMGIVPLIYVLGGVFLQYLCENSTSPTPSASSIFLSLPSIVCSLASMITMSLSPSFLHFPHCAAKSLRNNYFGPVLMFLFWQYLFNCWYCVRKPSGLPLHMLYATTTLHLWEAFAQNVWEQYLPSFLLSCSPCLAY